MNDILQGNTYVDEVEAIGNSKEKEKEKERKTKNEHLRRNIKNQIKGTGNCIRKYRRTN